MDGTIRNFFRVQGLKRTAVATTTVVLLILLQLTGVPAFGQNAPLAPGVPSVWAPAKKDFIGTSASDLSRVYFTAADGILTEVFYPTLDVVQNVDLQFIVTDAAKTWGDEEKRQRSHEISQVNKRAMVWQATTTADSGKWKITKKIFSDPGRNSVIQRVTFETLETGKSAADYNLYILNNPAINNSGGGEGQQQGWQDNSRTLTDQGRVMLVASEPNSTSSALAVSLPWKKVGGSPMVSNGFVGRNDGFTDLFGASADHTMDCHYDAAYGGNVAQMGWIDLAQANGSTASFDVVLSFGQNEAEAMKTANGTLGSDLALLEKTYTDQWVAYTSKLDNQNGKADDQYYLAAMTLKTIQDKSNGAMIAGLNTPWGSSSNDGNQGGYHLVWPRDLFKFASALIAAGDKETANKAVDFLFKKQMQRINDDGKIYSRIGRFPQNSNVSGTPYWNGTQMDETAMPIILAWKLHRTDLWPDIKLAAEYLANNGPWTGQERWEEMSGYSPSTIAAEIAGLVCAASIATEKGESGAAEKYLQKADDWRNNVANWTFTTTGPHGSGKYYIRINGTQDPDDSSELNYGNGGGTHPANSVVDGGFTELVRMGVMSPTDWTIVETMKTYDALLKQTLPGKGDAWFRYNDDGYGEHNDGSDYNGAGRGRLWPIFTAERGIYEIARTSSSASGAPYLQALKAFSSPAGFIPEQVWNQSTTLAGWQTVTPAPYVPGTATKSAQPLSWAMGEYINLIAAMNRQKSDAPEVVCRRYSCDKPQATVSFKVQATTVWGESVYLVGNDPLLSNWVPGSGIELSAQDYPTWSTTISLPASRTFQYKIVKRDLNGNFIWQTGPNSTFTTPASGSTVVNTVFK